MNLSKLRIRTGEVTRFSDGTQSPDQIARCINFLQDQIEGHLLGALGAAIEIGQYLLKVKARLPHGEFVQWYLKNTVLSERTARNYMKVARHKEELKTAAVAGLREAYDYLVDHEKSQARKEAEGARRSEKEKREQAAREERFRWLLRCDRRRRGIPPLNWTNDEEERFQVEKPQRGQKTRFDRFLDSRYRLSDPEADPAQEKLFGVLDAYFSCFEDPNQELHAIHNTIRRLKERGVACQRKVAHNTKSEALEVVGGKIK